MVARVPVRAKYERVNGEPVSQRVQFTPRPGRILSATDPSVIVVGGTVAGYLDETGALSIELVASGTTETIPAEFTYLVNEDFPGGQTYEIAVPASAGPAGIDLRNAAPVAPNPGASPTAVTRFEFDDLASKVAGKQPAGSYATTAELTAGLDTKADADDVTSALATKATPADVSAAVATRMPIAPDAPVGTFLGFLSANPAIETLAEGDWWFLLEA